MSAPARVPGLDGLRALAATLIVVHHAGFVSGFTFQEQLGTFTARFDVGVPIFFVLSGFLLGRPFVAALLDDRPRPDARRFLTKRALRIYPAYWVALVVLLVGGAIAVRGAAGFAWSALLLHSYHPNRGISGITQSWSLVAELAFYVSLLPASVLAARVLARRARTVGQRARVLLGLCVAAYLASLAFRGAIAVVDPSWRRITPQWFASMADQFALGVGLAVAREWADRRPAVAAVVEGAGRHTARWFFAAAVVLWHVSTQLELARGLDVAGFEREAHRQLLYGLVGFCLVAPLALAPTAVDRWRRLLVARPVAYVGTVSYGVYLWHQGFLVWMRDWFGWEEFGGHFPELLVGAFLLSVATATVSHRLLEAPLLRRAGSRAAKAPDERLPVGALA